MGGQVLNIFKTCTSSFNEICFRYICVCFSNLSNDVFWVFLQFVEITFYPFDLLLYFRIFFRYGFKTEEQNGEKRKKLGPMGILILHTDMEDCQVLQEVYPHHHLHP